MYKGCESAMGLLINLKVSDDEKEFTDLLKKNLFLCLGVPCGVQFIPELVELFDPLLLLVVLVDPVEVLRGVLCCEPVLYWLLLLYCCPVLYWALLCCGVGGGLRGAGLPGTLARPFALKCGCHQNLFLCDQKSKASKLYHPHQHRVGHW